VFVVNGDSDPMTLPHYSYLLAGLIPQAQVRIYPDSAHGFLFQHHTEFAADVEAFLSDPGQGRGATTAAMDRAGSSVEG
jgi:pimeloyl-ACP methyl ester carboxylesterase